MSGSENRPSLPGWTHIYSGKVRDVYVPADVRAHSGVDTYLIVASDRISAFDYVLPSTIPDKGKILNQLSLWWFDQLGDIIPNHFISTDVPQAVAGRAMITRRLNMFPIECVVRGYLTGSGMAEYQESGEVCGVKLPAALLEADRLEEPIFTPAAKAPAGGGGHDENITFEAMIRRVGAGPAHALRSASLAIYERARELAAQRGIIIADTKFEFGVSPDAGENTIILADEVLTPDSSRFWSMQGYEAGKHQPSLDKQFVRDWLTSPESGWDRTSGEQPPELPEDVIAKTRERYARAYETLTGRAWQ